MSISRYKIEREKIHTNLFRKHIPFESGQIFHRPDVVAPTGSFLASDRLSIEHFSNAPRHFLVLKFDPALSKVGLLR